MAAGDNHRSEAERLLSQAHHYTYGDGADPVTGQALATEAIGHALLAVVARQEREKSSREADATAAIKVEAGLADGPVRCPLCPTPLTLHTPSGARAHFTTVHPEQRITGLDTGPWPLLVGEKSSREADATPQADDALTLECSKLTCHRRAPLSEAREKWSRPAGEYGWLCADCAADFFQPGHTYRHSAWSFRCDALTTHPDTGERVALGWFRFSDQPCRPFTADGGHWRDGWRDITEPACDSEPPSHATTDTPGEGT
ncbi:hypothetical protein [Streptomyces sp. NPDC052535]|uniref:hypothetical protein n=1 Tax=Streptomyces sp. NPDC052535 TaxID=3155531 RepID=UPI00342F234E